MSEGPNANRSGIVSIFERIKEVFTPAAEPEAEPARRWRLEGNGDPNAWVLEVPRSKRRLSPEESERLRVERAIWHKESALQRLHKRHREDLLEDLNALLPRIADRLHERHFRKLLLRELADKIAPCDGISAE